MVAATWGAVTSSRKAASDKEFTAQRSAAGVWRGNGLILSVCVCLQAIESGEGPRRPIAKKTSAMFVLGVVRMTVIKDKRFCCPWIAAAYVA